MSSKKHHSESLPEVQESDLNDAAWNEVVSKRLPGNLEAKAIELKAWGRQRELHCVSDLLRALLAYVLCAPSFRQLGSWAVLIGLANLSNVAWRKRLRQARAWLLWLLCELLAGTHSPTNRPASSVPRILLIDATRLKEPGGTGDDWRVHLGYDLLAGRLVDVRVADRHTAEAFALFVLGPGDVLVADRGYSRRGQWVYALLRGADVVVRLAVGQVPLLDEQGAGLDVLTWLQATPGGTQSRWVAFEHEGRRFVGRLIACALNPEAAARARAKARKKADKQQRELKAETLFLAGWLLVFTSLPTDRWSDELVLALYRARWQIELLIKRMKQVLRLAQLRGQTALTNEATILALLVGWALQQQEAAAARAQLAQAAATVQELSAPATAHVEPLSAPPAAGPPAAAVSSWVLNSLCVQTLRVVVQGYWTPARLPYLQRFVCGSPRQRVHQETTIRCLLQRQAAQIPAGSALFFFCSSA